MTRNLSAMFLSMASALFFSAISGSTATGATIPVSVSGFNADVVVEATATPDFDDDASGFDVPNNWALYESGLAGGSAGLPAGGSFVSDTYGTSFQMADYSENNALLLTSTFPVGQLMLDTPEAYTSIHVLAGSTNSGTMGSMVVMYTDGSAMVSDYGAPDWFNRTGGITGAGNEYDYALQGIGRVQAVAGSSSFDDPAGNPDLFETIVPVDPSKEIASMWFVRSGPANAGTATGIFAISGETVDQNNIPEPSSIVLLGLGGLALAYRGLRR
ncbi:PEP-CTERM sorting domain-containing protein [Aeoliella mucimassa]|uniref:PEP-CTERM motif protein n=1 Tax=Aeoliella mucimassa TaxID=2527972 RepID=A0A518AS14_9BACT|nr:PEP-CTERM sorting domain-containing protein [Aeoliella mucimassa]QDU57512.1 PEP-CTERM motif protein [Aeoliella mucimassa]